MFGFSEATAVYSRFMYLASTQRINNVILSNFSSIYNMLECKCDKVEITHRTLMNTLGTLNILEMVRRQARKYKNSKFRYSGNHCGL